MQLVGALLVKKKKKKKHSNLSQGRTDEQQIKPYFLRGSLGFSRDLHHVTLCLRQSPHNPGSVSKPILCTVDSVQISQVVKKKKSD